MKHTFALLAIFSLLLCGCFVGCNTSPATSDPSEGESSVPVSTTGTTATTGSENGETDPTTGNTTVPTAPTTKPTETTTTVPTEASGIYDENGIKYFLEAKIIEEQYIYNTKIFNLLAYLLLKLY